MNSYNILYIIRQAEFGGGETHIKYIFDSMDRKLFTPILVSLSSGFLSDYAQSIGIKFYLLSKNKFGLLLNIFNLVRIIKKEKVDLIHAHGTKGAGLALIPAILNRKKMIYTVHAWSFHPELSKWKYEFRRLVERFICSYVHKVILVSQADFNAGDFISQLKKVIIRNGVDTRKFYPDKNYEFREELGYKKNDFVIGYFTRFTHQKNPFFVIELIKKLLQNNSSEKKKFKLLMIGDGELKKKILDTIKKENLTDSIKVLNPSFEIQKYLNVIDCYVLPSFWEGMPYGVLEAMACGIPVIVSSIPNMTEIVENEINGFCEGFEIENHARRIIQLAEDDKLYSKISLNARTTIEQKFNIDKQLQELYKIYQKLKVNDGN
jgi:glycosyltransferase involved in cell wall biosynthesis